MGRPLSWQAENSIGKANVKGTAKLHGDDITIRNVRFRTEDQGQGDLTGVEKRGSIQTKEEGGSIRLE